MFEHTDVIKSRISMIDICKTYGFNIQRGNFICCPFHNEKTPSLKLYDGNRGFYCFGCGEHGSVIDFVMRYFGLDFKSAISKLNDDFCLGLPIGQKIDRRKQIEMERLAFQRRQKAKQEEAERQQIEDAYWAAFDEWKRLDDNKRNYAPKTPTEPLHPLFVEALKNIASAEYKLSCADIARYEYENRNSRNS